MSFQLGAVDLMVKELMPRIKNREAVLSLSRYKITCPRDQLVAYLAETGRSEGLEQLEAAEKITSRELFRALGFTRSDDMDFLPGESVIVHDLNQPVPREYWGQYDLIVENGTMEHIFDVRTTFANIIKMLKTGGVVFHLSPLNLINHGFYNFSLTLFYDVYRNNGFEDFDFYLVYFPLNWWKNQHIDYSRIDFQVGRIEPEIPKKYFALVCFMAEKKGDIGEFKVPIQAIYDPDLDIEPVF